MRTLIPTPTHLHERDGEFRLPDPLPLAGACPGRDLLTARLAAAAGFRTVDGDGGIRFTPDEGLRPEQYQLDIRPDGVTIAYGDAAASVWAVQTLLQLLPSPIHGPGPMQPEWLVLPCVRIDDAPRYPWRGSHIDVARHFLPLDGLRRHLQLMSQHKLNVLHLHLTDDQGWRIPIPAYPRLTEVGAMRPGTIIGHHPAHGDDGRSDDVAAHDGRPHGGHYTREEITALIAEARSLGITVVPEIDMPGHMEAAVAAYPELGCTPIAHPRTSFGISEHVLALTEESVEFCRRVLDSVAELFPGSPIHIGGDECPATEWFAHEASQATMRRIGAETGPQAQAWFEQQIVEHVRSLGVRVIAWDEVLDADVPGDTTVMVWRDSAAVARAAEAGHDVIAAPWEFTYFDHAQNRTPDSPLSIGGHLTLEKSGGFTELLSAVPEGAREHILGGQFQLWTEYVHDWSRAEYQNWPRGCSIAQQLWAGKVGPAASYETLTDHTARLTHAGVNWCRG